MDSTMRRKLYCTLMSNDVFAIAVTATPVPETPPGSRPNPTQNCSPIDILPPIPKTKTGKQFTTVLIRWYLNMTRAIPSFEILSVHVESISLHHCSCHSGIPVFLLKVRGLQSVRKFFEKLYTFFVVKHLTTTLNHFQVNGQVESFRKPFSYACVIMLPNINVIGIYIHIITPTRRQRQFIPHNQNDQFWVRPVPSTTRNYHIPHTRETAD